MSFLGTGNFKISYDSNDYTDSGFSTIEIKVDEVKFSVKDEKDNEYIKKIGDGKTYKIKIYGLDETLHADGEAIDFLNSCDNQIVSFTPHTDKPLILFDCHCTFIYMKSLSEYTAENINAFLPNDEASYIELILEAVEVQ
jgi:hypothetical protein